MLPCLSNSRKHQARSFALQLPQADPGGRRNRERERGESEQQQLFRSCCLGESGKGDANYNVRTSVGHIPHWPGPRRQQCTRMNTHTLTHTHTGIKKPATTALPRLTEHAAKKNRAIKSNGATRKVAASAKREHSGRASERESELCQTKTQLATSEACLHTLFPSCWQHFQACLARCALSLSISLFLFCARCSLA